MFLLMMSRKRCVPASGANVRPDLRTRLDLFEQFPGKIVDAQARQRKLTYRLSVQSKSGPSRAERRV